MVGFGAERTSKNSFLLLSTEENEFEKRWAAQILLLFYSEIGSAGGERRVHVYSIHGP